MADGKRPQRLTVKVYYEDTDAGGVVYHANYLRYLERARVEWLAELGYSQRGMVDDHGILFVVRRMDLSYRAPARLEDRLEVETTPITLGPARLIFRQGIRAVDSHRAVVDAEVEIACVNASAPRLARMPQEILSRIRAAYPELADGTPADPTEAPPRLRLLRRAAKADVELLTELNLLLLEEERYDRSFQPEELRERMDGFLEGDYDAFVILASGEVAGYALVNRMTDPLYIRQFYVKPSFRRRGLGRAAVEELKGYYATNSFDVEVMEWNNTGMKFWAALGFRHRYNGLRSGA